MQPVIASVIVIKQVTTSMDCWSWSSMEASDIAGYTWPSPPSTIAHSLTHSWLQSTKHENKKQVQYDSKNLPDPMPSSHLAYPLIQNMPRLPGISKYLAPHVSPTHLCYCSLSVYISPIHPPSPSPPIPRHLSPFPASPSQIVTSTSNFPGKISIKYQLIIKR